MHARVAAAVAAAVLVGCATPPQMTREQYLATTARTFEVPAERAIQAAEQVLKLADGDDPARHLDSDDAAGQRDAEHRACDP